MLTLFKSWNHWAYYREKQFKSLIICLFNILLETENNLISKNTKDESRKLIWRGSFSKICGIQNMWNSFSTFHFAYSEVLCAKKAAAYCMWEEENMARKKISSLGVSNYYAWATDYLIFFFGTNSLPLKKFSVFFPQIISFTSRFTFQEPSVLFEYRSDFNNASRSVTWILILELIVWPNIRFHNRMPSDYDVLKSLKYQMMNDESSLKV